MTELLAYREETQKALLDLFASISKLAIGLYERSGHGVRELLSQDSLANFEPYCQMIRRLPGGERACHQDHCSRAEAAFESGQERLTLCWGGLYNQAIPIKVGEQVLAVLLYGQMQIGDEEHRLRSLEKHQEAVARLGLTEAQAGELRRLLLQAKTYAPEYLDRLKATLPKVGLGFYSLIAEEQRLKQSVERVTHELQTRLQAVIAHAENLMTEAPNLSTQELKKRTNEVLSTALALDTVVQNLGEFMREYRFRRQPIAPLLYEAKRLYQTEASGRGVAIYIHLGRIDGRPPVLEISKYHLQHALNNLVHNAVKYSFRPRPGQPRYVRITGRPAGRFYSIAIENYGVGILPDEIESGKIYEDGYQGKLTQGEYRTGSGKGLTYAKEVIDRHGGWIEVESRQVSEAPGPEGQPHINVFTIYLPYEQLKEGVYGEDDRVD